MYNEKRQKYQKLLRGIMKNKKVINLFSDHK